MPAVYNSMALFSFCCVLLIDTMAMTVKSNFAARHIGPNQAAIDTMLAALGCSSLEGLLEECVPAAVLSPALLKPPIEMQEALSEEAARQALLARSERNQVLRSFIGMGYHETIMPAVLRRNLLENPAWYTAYTPYQAEISQGRLEALLNFQQMVIDLSGMELANASLLDEPTAAAEAMTMCLRIREGRRVFLADPGCHPQTIAVLQTRARWLGIKVVVGSWEEQLPQGLCGGLLQNPGTLGHLHDTEAFVEKVHAAGALAVVAADPLALALLRPPGDCGADIVVGSTQRFGLPLGGGGPHAAFLAAREAFRRALPGRLVGVSRDCRGQPALRLALQTREQHIRREKATSNICTAQVLPAVLAGSYAMYHGAEGLREIAGRIHALTGQMADGLKKLGLPPENDTFFDTLTVPVPDAAQALERAGRMGYSLRLAGRDRIAISFGEKAGEQDLPVLRESLSGRKETDTASMLPVAIEGIPKALRRSGDCLQHPVFGRLHSETEMMRYLRRLAGRDIALDRSMIPLGSCTMKLNAATQMESISLAGFADMHPYAPEQMQKGYSMLTQELERMLCFLTGFSAISLQPNAGSQGEYAGLLAIRRYHESRGEGARDICLVPASAHGTNPASASLAGLRVAIVRCDEHGDTDLADLERKLQEHRGRLAALMVTYPSTHGVFEGGITEICAQVHQHGGQVYLDGANFNALMGVGAPGAFGADVAHLNLHKTFCIPHGGGGPGMGPIGVREHLIPFLPMHPLAAGAGEKGDVVAAAPWGSAGILSISWAYLRMMGITGLRRAAAVALLNANYIACRLQSAYLVLYRGAGGRVAHECIIDLRQIRERSGITEEDVAKRLMDFGFHAPTMSFPVAGTLMIEPTESESLPEIERFCEAMLAIREEIRRVEEGAVALEESPLRRAPHTAADLAAADWERPYSREEAVFPLAWLQDDKYWPPVGRVDNAWGDRNLFCGCPAPSAFEEKDA